MVSRGNKENVMSAEVIDMSACHELKHSLTVVQERLLEHDGHAFEHTGADGTNVLAQNIVTGSKSLLWIEMTIGSDQLNEESDAARYLIESPNMHAGRATKVFRITDEADQVTEHDGLESEQRIEIIDEQTEREFVFGALRHALSDISEQCRMQHISFRSI
jgi:hypothetical protein